MNNYKKPGSYKPSPALERDCFCNDGIDPVFDLHEKVFGSSFRFPIANAFTFCDCKLGREELAKWNRNGCSHCEHGFIYELSLDEEGVSRRRRAGYCQECEVGRDLVGFVQKEIAHQQAYMIAEWSRESGLAPLQRKQTFENYAILPGSNGEKAIAQLKIAAKESKSILLIGNTGVGKSHLAAAFLNFSISIGKKGKFISLTDLMADLRKTINAKPNYEQQLSWDDIVSKYATTSLLVLDDIGQEKPSEKVNEVLFTILNNRINWERPTIVTTNYGKDMLLEFGYSPAIVSRLGSFEIVRLGGDDYRVKNKAS